MTPPQRTADDWRYAALCLTALALHSRGPGKPTCAVIFCSIDEDNILERLLAEYWDAKDRSAVHTRWERVSSRHFCSVATNPEDALQIRNWNSSTATAKPGTYTDCQKLSQTALRFLGVPLPTVLRTGPACSQLPACRAEKVAAKLPRKDISSVRKRVALLEVRVPLA